MRDAAELDGYAKAWLEHDRARRLVSSRHARRCNVAIGQPTTTPSLTVTTRSAFAASRES